MKTTVYIKEKREEYINNIAIKCQCRLITAEREGGRESNMRGRTRAVQCDRKKL